MGAHPVVGGYQPGTVEVWGMRTLRMFLIWVREQCVMEGVEAALQRKEQKNCQKRLLDGENEATLTMTGWRT